MENMISILDFCSSHNVEITFITDLREAGLIEVTTVDRSTYISFGELYKLEKLIRFRYELDINVQGIETITHLLNRLDNMQQELSFLKNRLRLYENE